MLATNGPQWFDRRRPESTWPSIVVSIAATAALFATAFVAMQTVGRWSGIASKPLEPPIVVRLTPPPPPIERPRRAPPTTRPTPTQQPPSSVVPTTIAPPDVVSPPTTAAPPNVAPVNVPPPARDTALGALNRASDIPRGPMPVGRTGPDNAMGIRGGAPNAQAGVTIGSRSANTQALRDARASAVMKTIPQTAAERAPTGRELAELENSKHTALETYRRTTTAGSREVHVMQGEGMGGEGAVGGSPAVHGGGMTVGGGFSLPLFSSGPSKAQRKKNEAIDAEYQLGLRRLEDRLLLKRDSIRILARLDSIRRDSLRLDSLRRQSLARPRP
jgi:hypothetical protein